MQPGMHQTHQEAPASEIVPSVALRLGQLERGLGLRPEPLTKPGSWQDCLHGAGTTKALSGCGQGGLSAECDGVVERLPA